MSFTFSVVDCSARKRLIKIQSMYDVERHIRRLQNGYWAQPEFRLLS